MLFGKPVLQKLIPNGTRKWNVNDPTVMHMADFRVSKAELTTSKTMRVDGDPGPRHYGTFKLLQQLHTCLMSEQACSIHAFPSTGLEELVIYGEME